MFVFVFFFSSRRRHTRCYRDWSSDVCSSDLSWSNDGRWIYFASNRTGEFQIWKIPATGGEAERLTSKGGFGPAESPDGKYVYYAKGMQTAGLWRVPVSGGDEEEVLDLLPAGAWKLWVVTDRGIYFGSQTPPHREICFYNFSTRKIAKLGSIGGEPPGGSSLALSPDGR